MTLDELRVGQEARIVDITLSGAIGQRLLDMGFVEGTWVKIVRNAPLVDPIKAVSTVIENIHQV